MKLDHTSVHQPKAARRARRSLRGQVGGFSLWLTATAMSMSMVMSGGAAFAETISTWPGENGTEPPPPSAYPPGQEPPPGESGQGEDPEEASELQASFEPTLSPYGTWTEDPTYGRVWMPAPEVVGDSFVPYASNGHWVESEFGWTWVSGWDWGWAPFHYGRWAHLGGNGPWCWVPGTTWSPGWVAWRSGGGYAGWAALAPRKATLDPASWRTSWVFVRDIDLGQPYPLYQAGTRAPDLYRQTAPVRDTRVVNVGPRQVWVNPGPVTRYQGSSSSGVVTGVAPGAPAGGVNKMVIRGE